MKIKISKIRPNPNNPRHVIRQDMIDSMAASMAEVGLLNPVKLVVLTAEEKAAHPDFEFELISGHYRYEGAKKLGWTEIDAVILDLTPEQRILEAILDNKGQPMTWLDEYMAIEKFMEVCPDLNQQEVAARLEVTYQYVSCAVKVLRLLNTALREQICGQLRNPELSTFWEVPEAAVIALTGLATGYPDDIDKMERALKVLIDRKMTEKQAKKLAEWVKQGNTPESFPRGSNAEEKPPVFDPNDPFIASLEPLPKNFHVKQKAKGLVEISMILHENEALLAATSAAASIRSLAQRIGKDTTNPYLKNLVAVLEEAVRKAMSQPQPPPAPAKPKPTPIPKPSAPKAVAPAAVPAKLAETAAVNPTPATPTTVPANDNLQNLKDIVTSVAADAPSTIVGKLFKAGVKRFLK